METRHLISALKDAGHEVPYWVGAVDKNGAGVEGMVEGMVVHSYWDARNNIPPRGIDAAEFSPPEKSLIKELSEAESIILTMMNKHFDWMCVDERKHLYYNMLGYWNGVFKRYRPDVVIFSLIPHAPFNYVVYALAEHFGIKTIIFDSVAEFGVPWSDRMLLCVDSWKESKPFLNTLKENEGKYFAPSDLSDDLLAYYELHTTGQGDPIPTGVKEDKKKYSASRLAVLKAKIIAESVRDLSIFEKIFGYIQKLFRQNIKQEYKSVQRVPDFEKKFVYIPLHYQPECSTSPQGDIFVDQILMIETVSASVPDGWVIYVKEHPVQWLFRGLNFFSSRYRGYYKKIAGLKNVRLVPIETNHYALVNGSQAIATVTGSTGFEAILRDKPAIVFGYPWYQYCNGAFRVDGVLACQSALTEIMNGFQVDHRKVLNYLKSFDEVSVHGLGALSDAIGEAVKRDSKESMKNIIKTILSALKQVA